jgi:CheY-like chemotaxis protein
MQRPVILLVEDHPDTRDLFRGVLESVGYDVRATASGKQALVMVHELRPAAVLLDIELTDMDGVEVCRAIRRLGWFESLPILAVSGWVSSGSRGVQIAACDFTELLRKPVSPAELLTTVARWAPPPPIPGPTFT